MFHESHTYLLNVLDSLMSYCYPFPDYRRDKMISVTRLLETLFEDLHPEVLREVDQLLNPHPQSSKEERILWKLQKSNSQRLMNQQQNASPAEWKQKRENNTQRPLEQPQDIEQENNNQGSMESSQTLLLMDPEIEKKGLTKPQQALIPADQENSSQEHIEVSTHLLSMNQKSDNQELQPDALSINLEMSDPELIDSQQDTLPLEQSNIADEPPAVHQGDMHKPLIENLDPPEPQEPGMNSQNLTEELG